MSISGILKNNLAKETRARVIKLAQYFYLTNRISYGCFLYIITKPFYQYFCKKHQIFMAKHILKSVTVVDYNADIPVKTYIGKRDLLKKQLQQCSSYEDILESLEERELKEPHTIEELVELFSDTSQNLFLVLEEHEIQL